MQLRALQMIGGHSISELSLAWTLLSTVLDEEGGQ